MPKYSDKLLYTLKPTEAGNVLLSAIQRFFAEGKLVDVKISSENIVLLSCHKIILASFSSYFETLLMETEGSTVLNMDSIAARHAKQLRSIVNFMYGYSIQVYKSDCACLLEAAKMFGVSALIKTLQSNLQRPGIRDNDLLILKPTGISSLLLVNFQRFRKEKKFTDAKIGFGDDPQEFFLSHKLVLASFSTYFESLLQGTESCAILGLESVDPLYVRQLETIIDYMYGETVTLDDRQVDVLRDAAKVFGIYSLEEGELAKLCMKAVRERQQRLLNRKLASLADRNFTDSETKSNSAGKKKGLRKDCSVLVDGSVTSETAEIIRKAWKQKNLNKHNHGIEKVSSSASLRSSMSSPDYAACTRSLEDGTAVVDAMPLMDEVVVKCQEEVPAITTSSPFFDSIRFESQTDEQRDSILTVTNTLDFGSGGSCLAGHSSASAALIGEDVCVAPPPTPKDGRDLFSPPVQAGFSGQQEMAEGTTNGKYLCSDCGKLFKSTQSLSNHISAKHSTVENSGEDGEVPMDSVVVEYQLSPYSRNDFGSAGQEDEPVAEEVANYEDFEEASSSGRPSPLVPLEEEKLGDGKKPEITKCALCSFRGESVKELKAHVSEEHDGSMNICQNCLLPVESRKELYEHMKKFHRIPLLQCKKCSKEFQSKTGLKNHFQLHSNEKFECEECEYVGTTKSNLSLHMRTQHGLNLAGKKLKTQYSCVECQQKFPFKSLLVRHFKSVHLKVRSFQCPYCEYAATEKGALKMHIRSMHTREKPFACSECSENFTTQSLLARHKRHHHPRGKAKPHVCSECSEEFLESRDLKVHVYKMHRTERPFSCPECSLGFLRKDHLLNHRRNVHDVIYVRNL